jgi:phospholipid/cholesterol/gamma-HCH transport system substrate-binding protein
VLPVRPLQRAAVIAALVVAGVLVANALLSVGTHYTVHAHFVDASQLVRGARVEVGGRKVGSVAKIALTDDGHADVVLDLTAGEVKPLHRGTVAGVRAIGLSGVTNRFVDLSPGPPRGAKIGDGGVLTTAETRSMVDLDAVLNAFDPATRVRLQHFVKRGTQIFGDDGGKDANRALKMLDPAVAQARALVGETALDTEAVGRLVSTGATVAQTLAAHGEQVDGGLASTARTLQAVATQRRALASGLRRTPAVLRQAGGTLQRVDAALVQLRPALRELRPVAGPLATVLRRLAPTAQEAAPALRKLNALLPALRKAAAGLPALDRAAQPALGETVKAVRRSMPTFEGLRVYGPDVVHGALIGLGGPTSASYDATGHFARYSGMVTPRSVELSQQGRLQRCPGAAADPAPDGSTPWDPVPGLCKPEQGVGQP